VNNTLGKECCHTIGRAAGDWPPRSAANHMTWLRQAGALALKNVQQHIEFNAPRDDNARLANLCRPLDENLRQIEQAVDVTLTRGGHKITIRGRGAKVALTALENFYKRAKQSLSVDDIQLALVEAHNAARRGLNAAKPSNDMHAGR
jgi:phosphate starvation-inducible PhoH-like protein